MASKVLQLYPERGKERPLEGTYLTHRLDQAGSPEQPFVYANFVSSIDGRIAIVEGGEPYVLEDLASGHDWRLFQELQAQADCMVTHGSYLRALEAGRFPDILQVGLTEEAADLRLWRETHGLTAQPSIAVVSRSLDFVLPDSLARHGQNVHIITAEGASADRLQAWEAQGYPIAFAGTDAEVRGAALVKTLGQLGYTHPYLMAGPQLLETVLRDGGLSRLYLTLTHQLLGGETFHTISTGPLLGPAGRLRLHSLYYDPEAPKGTGQWFASFDLRERDPSAPPAPSR